MKETMKITLAPWVENSDVPMNDMYTDLTLEKMESKAEGYLGESLNDYTELFQQNCQTDNAQVTVKPDRAKRFF